MGDQTRVQFTPPHRPHFCTFTNWLTAQTFQPMAENDAPTLPQFIFVHISVNENWTHPAPSVDTTYIGMFVSYVSPNYVHSYFFAIQFTIPEWHMSGTHITHNSTSWPRKIQLKPLRYNYLIKSPSLFLYGTIIYKSLSLAQVSNDAKRKWHSGPPPPRFCLP